MNKPHKLKSVLKKTRNTLVNILKQKIYFVIFIIASLISIILMLYLNTLRNLFANTSIVFALTSIILSIIIAILFALSITLLIYRLRILHKVGYTEGSASIISTLFGAAASGCPVCGSLILSALGISAGLTIFPFRGIEVKLLSVAILLITLVWTTNKLHRCASCKV